MFHTTNQHIVGVLAPDGTPLAPTTPGKARILRKQKRAKLERVYPVCVIRLTYWPENVQVPEMDARIDDGETAGMILVQKNSDHERVVCAAEVKTTGRQNSDQLKDRGRIRRQRKRRGRQKRGEKGKPKLEGQATQVEGWYPRSIRLEVEQKVSVIRQWAQWFPITGIVLEGVGADIRRLLEAEVRGKAYQEPRTVKGRLKWGLPTECAVCGRPLDRDNYVTHHGAKRSRGGASNFTNEVPLCRDCHQTVGDDELCIDARDCRDTRTFGRLQHGKYLLLARLAEIAPVRVTTGYQTRPARQALGLPKSHVNDAIAAGQAGGPPIPLQLPAVVWHVYNPPRRSRKLFDEQFGVAKYRKAADRQPSVDRERMRVDDHDHAHNKRNRSYRRHIRRKYYRQLREEGQFNESLLGPSGKEIYSPNEAIGVTPAGRAVVVKRSVVGMPSPRHNFIQVFRRGQVVQTAEGWLGRVWALMSNGTVKILFTEKHNRKHPFTQRSPRKLKLVSRRICWLPKAFNDSTIKERRKAVSSHI